MGKLIKKQVIYNRCNAQPVVFMEFHVEPQWEEQLDNIVGKLLEVINIDNSRLYYYELMTFGEVNE